MSASNVRIALEQQLASISPAIATAWENKTFTPPAPDVPYQQAFVMFAQPDNPEMGPTYVDQGLMQVSLFFPKDAGSAPAMARAELIRAAFPFAASLTANGTVVNIINTPEIAPARPDEDRFLVPVKIRFRAFQGG